jgi:flagellar biosynthesis component FlhA
LALIPGIFPCSPCCLAYVRYSLAAVSIIVRKKKENSRRKEGEKKEEEKKEKKWQTVKQSAMIIASARLDAEQGTHRWPR